MLKVSAEKLGNVAILHFRGRIVIGDAIQTLQEAVRDQADACAVMLDLREVDLIDAGALGAMLELREWAQSKGIEFRLINVNGLVQQVLQITRLDAVLEVSTRKDRSTAKTGAGPLSMMDQVIGVEC